VERRDLASRLCTVWLQQALLSRFFPVGAAPPDVLVQPDGQLAFRGVYGSLSSDSKKTLWNYLVAASAGDPDTACAYLFKEMEKDPGSVRESDLRHRFRQVVPFRDCELEGGGSRNLLAAHLWVHVRVARAHGCRLPLPLARFYRGLFLVHDAGIQLAPGEDSLRDGLENVRATAALTQLRDLVSLDNLNQNLEKFAPLLLDLPRKMDEVLTLVAEGSARMHLKVRESAERRGQKNATATLVSLLLVLAGSALLAHHYGLLGFEGGWAGTIGFAVCVAAGALLLGRLSGSR